MAQTTCESCRYNQDGRCHDRTAYGPEGGDLPADDSPRLCYEPRQYLSEGLTLFLIELIGNQEKRRQ